MSGLDEAECRRRLGAARVGRLATVSEGGEPHVVPVVFVVDGNDLLIVVDAKPKSTTKLKRLRNIAANPAVSVLVDHYEEDWTRLWWVRADGTATIGEPTERELAMLSSKYPQQVATGPMVRIRIDRLSGWAP